MNHFFNTHVTPYDVVFVKTAGDVIRKNAMGVALRQQLKVAERSMAEFWLQKLNGTAPKV